ncbi:hypothetical protein [Mesorhizobium sp.]|uniref:hypothetical protein n=1 Tax=Mesorhizobium sp. TaxID=1871066 RepID=UPI0012018438|nr:hypothetical protein [Mesorhizobium sp.]TIL25833.1 MAG: hypothetical protein E5Y85_35085 [Mesorhizobium sp.]TIL49000.1 MAG: hypothetical protein E5Y83_28265 [Mesorhizobium sp.]TIL57678.1 MAG: hypothetical protein E5Y79_23270 [Mesorhizobium sp.]
MNDKAIPSDKEGPPDKEGPSDKGGPSTKADRKSRLAAQLRANLQKRKAQSRSRRTGETDKRPDGLGGLRETQKD